MQQGYGQCVGFQKHFRLKHRLKHLKTINLTQHPATSGQAEMGVTDLIGDDLDALKAALTFDELPAEEEIRERAIIIAELACMNGLGGDDGDDPLFERAMVGGAPWLMAHLANALRERGIEPCFAFSKRESHEIEVDGVVTKTQTFRHEGFVPAYPALTPKNRADAGPGNLGEVLYAFRQGANPNKLGVDRRSPLEVAAANGRLAIIGVLLAAGADVNAHGFFGNTPLIDAAAHMQLAAVSTLLSAGADPNETNDCGETALMKAAECGDVDIVGLLIGKGADVDAQDEDGMTAEVLAMAQGHDDVVSLLRKQLGGTLESHYPEINPIARILGGVGGKTGS